MRCESSFQRILDATEHLHPRNEAALEISEYLNEQSGAQALKDIFDSVFTPNIGQSVRHELEDLRQEFMRVETERMLGLLKSAKFRIDDPTMVMAITSSRPESVCIPSRIIVWVLIFTYHSP
jgi:hypothetical protein